RTGGSGGQKWKEKPKPVKISQSTEGVVAAESSRLGGLTIAGKNGGTVLANQAPMVGSKPMWKPKGYGTLSGAAVVATEIRTTAQSEQNGATTIVTGNSTATLSRLFKGFLLSDFTVDNSTYSLAQIRATLHPEFENERFNQEVSLKHSGSLFMYAGNDGGAYAKNCFGNVKDTVRFAWLVVGHYNLYITLGAMFWQLEITYTAVGDFVLGQMFRETWGVEATKKQAAFNDFLQGKEVSYILFAAYDAHCEEGTTTTVCKALDEVAEISVPGSKDHIKVQREILVFDMWLLACLLAFGSKISSAGILTQMKALLQSVGPSFCPTLVDWFGDEANNYHSRNAVDLLLPNFCKHILQILPQPNCRSSSYLCDVIDKPVEMCFGGFEIDQTPYAQSYPFCWLSLVAEVVLPIHNVSFCLSLFYFNHRPGLWPLYRASEIATNTSNLAKTANSSDATSGLDGLADEDANMMIKLKFLTYRLQTLLTRNGLSILFKEGPAAYKSYYLRNTTLCKTALCKEILAARGGLGDDRPINTLMGDLTKGEEFYSISCHINDFKIKPEMYWFSLIRTDSNPFSPVALSVFIFHVLHRVNHPGDFDSASPNAGYVLLMFYYLYEGKSCKDFEAELVERSGSIVKMPLLKTDSVPCHEISCSQYVLNEPVLFFYDGKPLPDSVKSILEEGINLYRLHTSRYGSHLDENENLEICFGLHIVHTDSPTLANPMDGVRGHGGFNL
ncbi:hypothetical protein RJ641_033032, partial [Dillenia turbinata]